MQVNVCAKGFPQDWFQAEHISKLLSVPFGALSIPIPSHAADYLERMYGQDVWEVAYADYNHAEEKRCEKVKVRLITKECAPYFDLPL